MISRDTLVAHCDSLLDAASFSDYCPNGLQVEGCSDIKKLVTGVTASQALIDAAIATKADTLLVHHGFFWRSEPASLVGMKRKRIAALLAHDINLIVYHLPLDAHAVLGNNAQLAQRLQFETMGRLDGCEQTGLVFHGQLVSPISAGALAERLQTVLGRTPLHVPHAQGNEPDALIKTIAWCTGAAQNFIDLAARAGVDAYITGEASEASTHSAREQGIHFYAAGHHATERYGVQALGAHLAEQFGIEHQFIEIDNPV